MSETRRRVVLNYSLVTSLSSNPMRFWGQGKKIQDTMEPVGAKTIPVSMHTAGTELVAVWGYETFEPQESTGPEEAIRIIERYGSIDGEHHKAWVIDQVARALLGDDYGDWRAKFDPGYEYDEGIAP